MVQRPFLLFLPQLANTSVTSQIIQAFYPSTASEAHTFGEGIHPTSSLSLLVRPRFAESLEADRGSMRGGVKPLADQTGEFHAEGRGAVARRTKTEDSRPQSG
jgi:hypothetical protein